MKKIIFLALLLAACSPTVKKSNSDSGDAFMQAGKCAEAETAYHDAVFDTTDINQMAKYYGLAAKAGTCAGDIVGARRFQALSKSLLHPVDISQ